MSFGNSGVGRGKWGLALACVAVLALAPVGSMAQTTPSVAIDLDRNTAGVQSEVCVAPGTISVMGCVVIQGDEASTVTSNVTRLRTDKSIDIPNSMLSLGDIPGGFVAAQGVFLESDFTWTNALPAPVAIGGDGFIKLFNFDVTFVGTCPEGSCVEFNYVSSVEAVQAGVSVDGQNYDYVSGSASGNPILVGSDVSPAAKIFVKLVATETPTETPFTNTPTNTMGPVVTPDTPTPTNTTDPVVTPDTPTPTSTTVVDPTATPTSTNTPPDPTNTPTNTRVPTVTPSPTTVIVTAAECDDSGYYVLDKNGGRFRVGSPVNIGGALAFGSPDARDMEKVFSTDKAHENDLAVLDRFGIVTFVANPGSEPEQTFGWPSGVFPCGEAVDVIVSRDYQAFWVLTRGGGIYRGGNARTTDDSALLGNDAANLCNVLDIPFPPAIRNGFFGALANDNATLRAVGLTVAEQTVAKGHIETPGDDGPNANPDGFVVIDSQGGSYLFDGQGNSIRDAAGGNRVVASNNVAGDFLNPDTVYPFFPGLDIAREVEQDVTEGKGDPPVPNRHLVILDGWGGIHPVPVNLESDVRFLRNEQSLGGPPITTVGMPYLVLAFDDAATPADEGGASWPADANSIFKDIEFCTDGSEGVYTMDCFGAIFAFGTTRVQPDNLAPGFSGSPYFFPRKDAVDMEPFGQLVILGNGE